MADMKHTPGIWAISEPTTICSKPVQCITISKEDKVFVKGPNAVKNTRLIATAPELLATLETIVEHLAESHATEKDAEHYGDDPKECSYCQSIAAARAAIDKAHGIELRKVVK